LSTAVRDGDDDDPTCFDPVDDAEWKSAQQVPPCAVIKPWVRFGELRNRRFSGVNLFTEY
jgi:hypothetical protein